MTDQRVRKVSQILYELKRGKFDQSELWDRVTIPLPLSLEPSQLPYCRIMNVSYSIQVI